jgi:hypothetical protein
MKLVELVQTLALSLCACVVRFGEMWMSRGEISLRFSYHFHEWSDEGGWGRGARDAAFSCWPNIEGNFGENSKWERETHLTTTAKLRLVANAPRGTFWNSWRVYRCNICGAQRHFPTLPRLISESKTSDENTLNLLDFSMLPGGQLRFRFSPTHRAFRKSNINKARLSAKHVMDVSRWWRDERVASAVARVSKKMKRRVREAMRNVRRVTECGWRREFIEVSGSFIEFVDDLLASFRGVEASRSLRQLGILVF